jgi:hypothetical protein
MGIENAKFKMQTVRGVDPVGVPRDGCFPVMTRRVVFAF